MQILVKADNCTLNSVDRNSQLEETYPSVVAVENLGLQTTN